MRDRPDNPRRRAYQRCFGRGAIVFAWIVVAVAFVHPPHGTGVPICWMSSHLDVPCPGCGLTRSVSCAARGMLDESWSYHPFGVAVLGGAALLTAASFMPVRVRRRAAARLLRRARLVQVGYLVFVAGFVAFGAWRAVAHFTGS